MAGNCFGAMADTLQGRKPGWQIFSLPAKKTNMLVSPSPGNWVSQKPYRLSRAVEAVSPEKYKAWRAAPSVVIDVTQNIKAERAPVVQYVCKKNIELKKNCTYKKVAEMNAITGEHVNVSERRRLPRLPSHAIS